MSSVSLSEDNVEKLTHAAALFMLGRGGHEEVTLIDSFLGQGIYCDEFLELIDSDPSSFAAAFLKVLRKFGLAFRNPESAVWWLIDHHTKQMLAADADAIKVFDRFIPELWFGDFNFRNQADPPGGFSHGVGEMFAIYWNYDDLRAQQPALAAHHVDAKLKEIVGAATKWQHAFGAIARERGRPGA
jgi:hypothetical protein